VSPRTCSGDLPVWVARSCSRWRFLPTSANGQLAFGTYLWDDSAAAYVPGGLDVLTIEDGQVAQFVAFLSADLTDFGLPASVRAS
jgi:hypothetical protein